MSIDQNSTHYDAGGIETVRVIEAKLSKEQFEGFLLGNIIKYSCRANFKENFFRDMEKVHIYSGLLSGLWPKREEEDATI